MQTIGERLEEARKRKGISIREAAEGTKIRGDYLHKFESNQFDIKLPEIYVHGFLRIYANFLKLPGEKLVADYAALGLGEGGRPQSRGLNREIYGKMEISRSGASATGTRPGQPSVGTAPSGAAAALTPEADSVAPAAQRQPFQPRMPLGGLDRALLAKNGVWIGVGSVVLLGFVIWGVVALVGGGSEKDSSSIIAPIDEPVYLVAQRPVQIISVKATADGREIVPPRALGAGERCPLPNTDMLVNVSAREAVLFEYKGQRYGAAVAGTTGPGTLGFKTLP